MSDQLAPALRSDLMVPMFIFSGVFVLSAALSGAADSTHPHSFAEDVQVIRAENVIGGPEADFVAACKKDQSSGSAKDVRCRHKRFQSASLN